MFGDGISFIDLTLLLKGIREKDLTLQVKISNGQWEDLSKIVITKMISAITSGNVTQSNNIQLRLFSKNIQRSAHL